jgi:hypothetical protein
MFCLRQFLVFSSCPIQIANGRMARNAGIGRELNGSSGASNTQKPAFLFANTNISRSSDASERGFSL